MPRRAPATVGPCQAIGTRVAVHAKRPAPPRSTAAATLPLSPPSGHLGTGEQPIAAMSLSALQSLSALSRTAPLRLNPALVCRQCLARSPTTPARPLSLLARKLATNAIPLQPQLRSFSITPRAFKKKHQYRKQPLGLGNLVEAFERAEQEAPPPPKESKPPERNISGHLPRDPPRGRWFPVISDRIVGYWLLGSAGLVFGIVVLGGFTRLTESG